MAACLLAFKIVPGKKPPEVAEMIRALLDWLEQCRKENADNEGITNETAAHALIEEYALRLFEYGDQQDKAEIFNKYVHIFDLGTFKISDIVKIFCLYQSRTFD